MRLEGENQQIHKRRRADGVGCVPVNDLHAHRAQQLSFYLNTSLHEKKYLSLTFFFKVTFFLSDHFSIFQLGHCLS